jgi:hypothetical protein
VFAIAVAAAGASLLFPALAVRSAPDVQAGVAAEPADVPVDSAV